MPKNNIETLTQINKAAKPIGGNITIINDSMTSNIPKANSHPQLLIPRFLISKECPIKLTPLNINQNPMKKDKIPI